MPSWSKKNFIRLNLNFRSLNIGLSLECNSMEHHCQLIHIHPGKKGALAIADRAVIEQGILPACQHEGLASG